MGTFLFNFIQIIEFVFIHVLNTTLTEISVLRLKGVQPVLRLTTKDGAIFQNSDPISLAFAENSAIASTVLEWIMPPLASRYMETCAQTKTSELVFIAIIWCFYMLAIFIISN